MANDDNTKISSAHHERFHQNDAIKAIKDAKAKPLFIADGTAIELADMLKKYGNKQLSIVVLT